MAIVYEAHQISMNRRVAAKVLPNALTLKVHFLSAFNEECRIMASLNHANIVPAFALGCERGVHYIIMKFIEGRPIDIFVGGVAKDKISFDSITSVFIQAAEALEYAHQSGVIHRDIEPGNLLVDKDQKLWLIDWGLAQPSDCRALSMAGGELGTLRFMSPELALMNGPVDQRVDTYSLGAVLYEVLTQKPAIRGKQREEILHGIDSQEPEPLRRYNKTIPPNLEKIVLKAIAKDPSRRYQTAEEMSDALKQFVN
jgi:serine/threonine protein kinase